MNDLKEAGKKMALKIQRFAKYATNGGRIQEAWEALIDSIHEFEMSAQFIIGDKERQLEQGFSALHSLKLQVEEKKLESPELMPCGPSEDLNQALIVATKKADARKQRIKMQDAVIVRYQDKYKRARAETKRQAEIARKQGLLLNEIQCERFTNEEARRVLVNQVQELTREIDQLKAAAVIARDTRANYADKAVEHLGEWPVSAKKPLVLNEIKPVELDWCAHDHVRKFCDICNPITF